MLKRAADWNGWTDDNLLLQLAGHQKGRALQEWNLLSDKERETYRKATAALQGRLDPGSRIMAAQDFRHASQEENKKVCDFIRRMEQLFKIAYGHESISSETRSTLLYGQLQDGLKHQIMEAPAVSGATDYQALCLAAKTEEKRLAKLKKRSQYQKQSQTSEPRSESWRNSLYLTLRVGVGPRTGGAKRRNAGTVGRWSVNCKALAKGGFG